jgi:hypothetical protein
MSRMTTYYRVNIERGIEIEIRPYGYYSRSEELGVTVFKKVFDAKRQFDAITRAEIERLTALRRRFKGFQTRHQLLAMLDQPKGEAHLT